MSQFDVHENRNQETAADFPYLVDLQSELLSSLATTVVAPLASRRIVPMPLRGLNPEFTIDGVTVVLSIQEMAGLSRAALGDIVASLSEHRAEIINALDLLFTGT